MQSCVVTRNRTPADVMFKIRVRPDRAFRHRCLAAKECKIRVLGNNERDDDESRPYRMQISRTDLCLLSIFREILFRKNKRKHVLILDFAKQQSNRNYCIKQI